MLWIHLFWKMAMKMNKPTFLEEKRLWREGIEHVIGIDEVGRGAFAGPIVAAGVIYKPDFKHPFLGNVNDSKLLKPKFREELAELIKQYSLFYTIESIETKYINKHGIGKANTAVFRKVLKSMLKNFNDLNHFILIDGFHCKYLPGGIKKQKAIIKGDRKSLSIASASIIAKVYRDNLMREASNAYPNYNFEQNKGYGTKLHRDYIKIYGLCKIHRSSFNLEKFMQA